MSTNFNKEFMLYESLFDEPQGKVDTSKVELKEDLKEGHEVWVEGEQQIMPDEFYNATQAVTSTLDNIEEADVDAYDNHYFDGEKMQWESMWNIFEPITFDIDALEKQLTDLVATYSNKLSIFIDREMLEEEGCLNISLTIEADTVENM